MSDHDSGEKPRAGRVRHDSGGRAIWEWAVESGKHAVDSTSHLLKKLELTGLTLMGEDKPWERKKPGEVEDPPPLPLQEQRPSPPALDLPPEGSHGQRGGAGFNPYDPRTPVGRAKAPARKPASPPPAAKKKAGLLARLFGRG